VQQQPKSRSAQLTDLHGCQLLKTGSEQCRNWLSVNDMSFIPSVITADQFVVPVILM